MRDFSLILLFGILTLRLGAGESAAPLFSPDSRFIVGEILVRDDFWTLGLASGRRNSKKAALVSARDGQLEIDVPGGATIWLKTPLTGPLLISYDAVVVGAGGPNDRVSDLNCFWMAHDERRPGDIFAAEAPSGKFARV